MAVATWSMVVLCIVSNGTSMDISSGSCCLNLAVKSHLMFSYFVLHIIIMIMTVKFLVIINHDCCYYYCYHLLSLWLFICVFLLGRLFQSPRIGVLEKCWRLVGKVARYGFLNLFSGCCAAVSLTLPLRFHESWFIQGYGSTIKETDVAFVCIPAIQLGANDYDTATDVYYKQKWHIYIYVCICIILIYCIVYELHL